MYVSGLVKGSSSCSTSSGFSAHGPSCSSVEDEASCPLPEREPENFFGDCFTFAIGEIDPTGEAEKIAGANNIYAA